MSYTGVTLDELIQIKTLYSVHYFEYMSDFSFGGESHDFWEFIYVDKGEVGITADTAKHILKKGEIAFHKPNEFHDVTATGYSAPNLIVVSFQCTSPYMSFFENKILKIEHPERQLLANIILEAQNCFEGSLNDTYQTTLIEKHDVLPENSSSVIIWNSFCFISSADMTIPVLCTKIWLKHRRPV